jgi:hypothetical protein
MKLKPIEELTLPTMFDGLYLGACLTGLELIFVVILSLVHFFIFARIDALQSYLIATLFATNIFFVIFLKHNGILSYSVWKEITTERGKIERKKGKRSK